MSTKPKTNKLMESTNCQTGTPNGIRDNITIGDVNGTILAITEMVLSGLLAEEVIIINPTIMGKVTGRVNCCAS